MDTNHVTHLLCALLSVPLGAACGTAGPVSPSRSDQTTKYALGYNYVTANHKALVALVSADGGVTALAPGQVPATSGPPAVDNSMYNPPVGNQGNIGSCVAWSTTYGAAGYLANWSGLGSIVFAPMYVYTQESPNCVDCGMEPSLAFGIMQQGLETAADYDAVVSTSTVTYADEASSVPGLGDDASANDLNPPTAQAQQDARMDTSSRLGAFEQIYDTDPAAGQCAGTPGVASAVIQSEIEVGFPVVVAIPVYDSFYGYDGVHPVQTPQPTESYYGNHAIFCTKYDPNGLWCQNSWGPTWGQAGSVQLAWSFVDTCLMEADVELFLSSGPAEFPPNPTLTAPDDGSTVSGTVSVAGFVIPGSLALSSVSVAIDDGGMSPAALTDTNFSWSFDSTALNNGDHTLTVTAFDIQAYNGSSQITVQVHN